MLINIVIISSAVFYIYSIYHNICLQMYVTIYCIMVYIRYIFFKIILYRSYTNIIYGIIIIYFQYFHNYIIFCLFLSSKLVACKSLQF